MKFNRRRKFCECGCGESVRLPLHRFIYGHNGRKSVWKPKLPSQLCACGKCGLMTKAGNKFIKGHFKRISNTEEHNRKIGLANSKNLLGNVPWNAGKKGIYSEEHLKKLRESHLGHLGYWQDKTRSEETNKAISEKVIKLWQTPEYIAKHIGENNPNWQGGIKFPYSQDWTEDLKDAIRKRDNYQCQMCESFQGDLNQNLSVHHIDYDKENCNPPNLISLCLSCHAKTSSGGKRNSWILFFEKLKGAQKMEAINA